MSVETTSRRGMGIALVATGAVLWSTAGVIIRLVDLDIWTVLMWRSLFGALVLVLIVLVQNRARTFDTVRGLGWPGLAAIPLSAMAMYCYVSALKLTTVANVMIVYATLPFIAAGLSFVWMGERPKQSVLLASGIALVGVAIIGGTATRFEDVAGIAFTLAMTVAFAIILVMARRYPAIDMAPVNAAAALICALASWPLAASGVPSGHDLLVLALFGVLCTGIGFLLFLTGGRFIPSSEAGLVGFLDVVLGPLWVWLAYRERPANSVLVGGTFVLASVLWYLGREVIEGRRMAGAAETSPVSAVPRKLALEREIF